MHNKSVEATTEKNSQGHLIPLACSEGESLAIPINNLSPATSYLPPFILFRFFVFWRELLRPASFLVHRVCLSFFTLISLSKGANSASKQNGTHHSSPTIRVLHGWYAPALFPYHHVQVSRGTHYSTTFTLPINISVNFVKRAHQLLKTLHFWPVSQVCMCSKKVPSDHACVFCFVYC